MPCSKSQLNNKVEVTTLTRSHMDGSIPFYTLVIYRERKKKQVRLPGTSKFGSWKSEKRSSVAQRASEISLLVVL